MRGESAVSVGGQAIRFATFDGDQVAFRFRVIAVAAGGPVRLIEFAVIG